MFMHGLITHSGKQTEGGNKMLEGLKLGNKSGRVWLLYHGCAFFFFQNEAYSPQSFAKLIKVYRQANKA